MDSQTLEGQRLPQPTVARESWWRGRALSLALRGLVAGGLLAALLWRLDLSEVAAVVAGTNPGWLLVALGLAIAAWVLPALAWSQLTRVQGLQVPPWRLILFQYTGLFFNNFAPSNLGGDVARAYLLSRWTSRAVEASVSVVMLKLTTVATLVAMAVVAVVYARDLAGARLVLGALLALIVVASGLSLGLILVARRAQGASGEGWRGRLLSRLEEGWRHLGHYWHHPWALAGAFGYLVLFHSVNILVPYTIGVALSLPVEALSFFLFVPMIRLFTMMPVSINGLGVREGAFIVFFTQVGLSPAAAFSLSLLQYMVTTLASLPGGLLYLSGAAGVHGGD